MGLEIAYSRLPYVLAAINIECHLEVRYPYYFSRSVTNITAACADNVRLTAYPYRPEIYNVLDSIITHW
jgi:hypothetical protein